MFNHLHKHSQTLFQSNLGITVGFCTMLAWLAHQAYVHQAIDIPGAVSLIGFLLLFFVERSHGRDMKAINLKLDELLAAQVGASNRLIRVEEAPEEVVHLAHAALHSLAATKAPHEAVSIEHTDFFEEHELAA